MLLQGADRHHKPVAPSLGTYTGNGYPTLYSLPPNLRATTFIHNYIRENRTYLSRIRENSCQPFSVISKVLDEYALPRQLKYLAVIESELKSTATSRVGAVGPWQLMPETAQSLGLRVNHNCDERTNYLKSTKAAAIYLKDLYQEFGDWLLVLAAYNGGPGSVYRAMRKADSRNFWVIQNYLPAESRMHVQKFIATQYYFEYISDFTISCL